jgi:hypothetical protein
VLPAQPTPSGQATSQLPQWFGSTLVSVQVPEQHVSPLPQQVWFGALPQTRASRQHVPSESKV